MKKLFLSILVIFVILSCDKEYLGDGFQESEIKVIYDTVFICPDDTIGHDSLIVVDAILSRTNSPRSCFYIYDLPPILNDGPGPEYIINPPLKFDWDCEWEQTEFMDLTNIGPTIILSPDKPRLFGDIAYKILYVGQFYVQPFGIGIVDRLGTDSLIVAFDNPKVNIPDVIIKHESEVNVTVDDFLELTPRN